MRALESRGSSKCQNSLRSDQFIGSIPQFLKNTKNEKNNSEFFKTVGNELE